MKYIGYYPAEKGVKRNASPAGKSKMDYIISLINRNNQNAEIISASDSISGFSHGKEEEIGSGNTIRTFMSFGKQNKISILADFFIMKLQLLLTLIVDRHTICQSKVILFAAPNQSDKALFKLFAS